MMGAMGSNVHRPGHLSDENCWLLMRRLALPERNYEGKFEKFQETGREIAKMCKGLPLAAKVVGSLLLFKSSLEEWERVLNSEIWRSEEAEEHLFPHLLLSYNELSPTLKHCFSYCVIFPKDYEIDVKKLIGNWMALGYLGSNVRSGDDKELKGQEYFQNLAVRCLFQDFRELDGQITSCKMHDIVHDFALSHRKDKSDGSVETRLTKKTTCQSRSDLVSHVKECRSLFWEIESNPPNLCDDYLTCLRVLRLNHCYLHDIPQGIGNLIHLRWLDLSCNVLSGANLKTIFHLYHLQALFLYECGIREIPNEIGNLIHLRHLDLNSNYSLKELPESICGVVELRTLSVWSCTCLSMLPQGIHRLINLEHLHNRYTDSLHQFPQGVAQLIGLRTVREFRGGNCWSKLGWLKNLNRISGSLDLFVRLASGSEDVVEDAREAELRKKRHIQELNIKFQDEVDEKESSSVWIDVIDALEPHPNLQNLRIFNYHGSKLPGWIISPLNQLSFIGLYDFKHVTSLSPLGKLQCLERVIIDGMLELEVVGREFLGITRMIKDDMDIESSSSSMSIGFPKLKILRFFRCPKWKEWKDITAEEEESSAVSIMPCLTELRIEYCKGLTALPHCLLRKASSTLEEVNINGSTFLLERYEDQDGSAWKSISQNNPRLQLQTW